MPDGDTQIKSYRDLHVWQEAVNLSVSIYGLTRGFPKSETYGLSGQMQRAAVSIAANIAEGHGREQTGLFIQHLRTAQGSLKELETHLIIAERAERATAAEVAPALEKCDAIGRMLRSLIRSLEGWQSRTK